MMDKLWHSCANSGHGGPLFAVAALHIFVWAHLIIG